MKYDVLGIPLHSSQPTEVERIASEMRDWLNDRAARGYTFACSIAGVYATIIVVEKPERNPLEHGD